MALGLQKAGLGPASEWGGWRLLPITGAPDVTSPEVVLSTPALPSGGTCSQHPLTLLVEEVFLPRCSRAGML